MNGFLGPIAGLTIIGLIVAANMWNARRRAAMTPAERAADEAKDQREANIW
jgi:hypothetical protein